MQLNQIHDTSDSIAQTSDPPALPQAAGNGSSGDFAFAVYTQLAQIQREVGAVTVAQRKFDAHVKELEVRITDRVRESELRLAESYRESEVRLAESSRESERRLTERVEKFEKSALDRMKTTEDKLSSLREFVYQLFWTGAGVVTVVGVVLGWRPIWAWMSTQLI